MASELELKEVRLGKLQALKDAGIDPYPSYSNRTHTISEVLFAFDQLEKDNEKVTIAGRVMSMRGQGAISFTDLFDGTDTLQAVLKKDNDISYSEVEIDDAFKLYKDTIDMGDFIEVTGSVFVTDKGQQSIFVSSWRILTKTLLPIPDGWYGLQDDDERYRKRYLDLLGNEELREMFAKKALFWQTMRNFLTERGFLEVETPTLEITTGGAEARPFETHHNDFDMDVFMRISVGELWQKRLMAAGFPKTFEIGRIFRNEGTSPEHLQEFTNMEFYWAYADFEDGMKITQDLYRELAKRVFGTTRFETRGHTFDLADEWERIDYVEAIKEKTGVNILEADEREMKDKLQELKVTYEGDNKERLTDTLWKYCRKQISGPAFLINHPTIVAPLAKENEEGGTVQRFQVLLAGSEIGNGYSELNDPIDQAQRFEKQKELIESGDEEAMMSDDEFVEMLEYGMPPTCGFGVGERLFSFFVDKPIRETQLFPLMRPKN